MTNTFRLAIILVFIILLFTSVVHAAKSDDATMELQYRFPICSEVLKAKQHSDEESKAEQDLLEGAELLPLLNQYKRQGANLNAYFRLGTPLHHAACAGWGTEVLWLLRNGANPFLAVENDRGADVLGVAVRTENWQVATILLKHYKRLLKTSEISAKEQALIHTSVEQVTQYHSEADESTKKYQRLLKKIGWNPSPKVWGEKYGKLLCNGKVKAALNIVKAQPWGKTPPAEVTDATWVCQAFYLGEPMPKIFLTVADMPSWGSLDALLPNPVLLPLVPVLANGRAQYVLQAGVAQGLRAPWSSQDLATVYFQAVMSRRDSPVGEEPSLLRLIPPEHLQYVLAAQQTTKRFNFTPYSHPLGGIALLRTGAWPLADLEWLLARLDSDKIKAVQDHLSQYADSASAEHWGKITLRLVAPLSIPSGYPKSLPYIFWPKWKAVGAFPAQEPSTNPNERTYTWSQLLASIPMADLAQGLDAARQLKEASPQSWPTEMDWANLLLRAQPDELAGLLALIKTQRPDLLPRLMDWALSSVSFGTTPDAVAMKLTPPSFNKVRPHSDGWDLVRRLTALGFKARYPRYPIQDLSDANAPAPTMEEAITNGWIIARPQTAKPVATIDPDSIQWSQPMLSCHKKVEDGLRLALVKGREEVFNPNRDRDRDRDAYLVPIQVDGLRDCQWLLVGGRFPGVLTWMEHDFFDGDKEQRINAADGSRYALFWNSTTKKFTDSGVVPDAGEVMLVQQSGQAAPWVAISGREDWGQFPNDILNARLMPDNTVVLDTLPADHPRRISLIQLCGGELMLGECKPLDEVNKSDAKVSIAQFADTYWPQARQEFLNALLRNDRVALNDMREVGLFPHWLSAGLQALSETNSLGWSEKRQQAGWILALSQPSPDYDEATLNSLLLWLPAEDWRAIVQNLGCYAREKLLEQVAEKRDALFKRLQYEMKRVSCS